MNSLWVPLTSRKPCLVHPKHKPEPHLTHIHHIWPLGDGGPDVEANTVVICPTGHYNVHALLDLYRLHRGKPPHVEVRRFGYGERDLAETAWRSITRAKASGVDGGS